MTRDRSPRPHAPDFRALFESAPGLYLVLAPDLTILAVSDAYLRATMTRREEILGRGIFEVFPDNPDDPAASGEANLRASLSRVIANRQTDAMAVQKYDIRKPASEGGGFEVRYWSPVNSPVLSADGSLAYIIHRVEDVTEFIRLKLQDTEQHKVAEELRDRTSRMEREIYDRAQELQEANRELRTLQTELERRVAARTEDLQRANDDLTREVYERRKTEEALRRSEDQLRQSQKLEAVGRLAGGVAHDFNNLLTVILSYSEVLLDRLGGEESMRKELVEIRRAGERAADLTRQLLAFSRQQVLEPTVLDLNEVLTEVSALLERTLGEDVEVKMALAPDLGRVRADRGQVEQVIMNLAVNARDAMPEGGHLILETANTEIGEAFGGGHLALAAGPYVVLAVSDTGTGMSKEIQTRVFEPFFTTKEMGKGTGLGLSTVFGIVKQSGGSIWLYSEPGSGTTFKVYLPLVLDEATTRHARPALGLHRGTETILLAEDEDQVRQVATSILRAAGYRVLEARTPGEALDIAQQFSEPIDLLLSDLVMPKMTGRQLAEGVRPLRPETKVLFMSGYTDDVVLRYGISDSAVAFLQKPLTPDSLTRKVRQVLDAVPAS